MITIYKSAGTQVNVINGEPPVDQSAEVAALQAQVAALNDQIEALNAKIAAAQLQAAETVTALQ